MELLFHLGIGIVIIGNIWFLIAAFQESVLWAIGCFLLPPVSLVFLAMHWSRAKNPFFLQLAGIGTILLAALLGAEIT